jgi:hypothetical protein
VKVKFLASPSPSISEGPLIDLNNSETASSKSFDETDKDVKGEGTDNELQVLKGNFLILLNTHFIDVTVSYLYFQKNFSVSNHFL